MVPKWFQHDPKLFPNWSQTDPKMIPRWFQIDPKIIPNLSQNNPKLMPKWSQIDPKTIPNYSIICRGWSLFKIFSISTNTGFPGALTYPARFVTPLSIRHLQISARDLPHETSFDKKSSKTPSKKGSQFWSQNYPKTIPFETETLLRN